jgi:hypothetical protein
MEAIVKDCLHVVVSDLLSTNNILNTEVAENGFDTVKFLNRRALFETRQSQETIDFKGWPRCPVNKVGREYNAIIC